MKPTFTFSFKRIGLLIQHELRSLGRPFLLIIAVISVLAFLFLYLHAQEMYSNMKGLGETDYIRAFEGGANLLKSHWNLYLAGLILGGIAFSSFSFPELRREDSKQFYLSLPATIFEKWLSKWGMTGIIFPLVYSIAYQVFMYLGNWLIFQSTGIDFSEYNPFSILNDDSIWIYFFIGQAIFLWGAVTFDKLSIFKTGIFLILMYFPLVIAWLISANMYIPDLENYWNIFEPDITKSIGTFTFKEKEGVYEFREQVLKTVLAIITVLFWLSSFLKLKEKEA